MDIKEVSNTITIGGLEIENTQEAISAFHEAKRKSEETRRAEELRNVVENHTGKVCPLKSERMESQCKKDCALYRDDGCALKRSKATAETKGKNCPFIRVCKTVCALYENGCTI